VSFLKFLLSRARDVDAFRANQRWKQRSPWTELYPKGFTSPHFSKWRSKDTQRANTPDTLSRPGSDAL
jgi:hypothetical protein